MQINRNEYAVKIYLSMKSPVIDVLLCVPCTTINFWFRALLRVITLNYIQFTNDTVYRILSLVSNNSGIKKKELKILKL